MPAAAVALFTALILEVGQLSRMDLQPSVTAILWQATAAWLAFVVVRGLLPPAGLSHKSVSRLRTRGRRVGAPVGSLSWFDRSGRALCGKNGWPAGFFLHSPPSFFR